MATVRVVTVGVVTVGAMRLVGGDGWGRGAVEINSITRSTGQFQGRNGH